MTKKCSLELLCCLLCGAMLAPAQVPAQERLGVYALQCYVPPTPGLHTRATAWGVIRTAQRNAYFVASCQDGPSPARWPEMQAQDGAVHAIETTVVTVLTDAQGRTLAYNYCGFTGLNGFVTGRCLAHEQRGGEVNLLLAVPPAD